MLKIINLTIYFLIFFGGNTLFARNLTATPYFRSYTEDNICTNNKGLNYYITALNISEQSNFNNHTLYGIMRDNKKSYTLKLKLTKNHLDSLALYDNTKPLGYGGYEGIAVLNVHCSDLYENENECNLEKIYLLNNSNEELIKLCMKNKIKSKVLNSYYIGSIFGKYMLANGFKTKFINDLIKYKEQKNNGIADY